MFFDDNGRLVFRYDSEELWVEPWGVDSLRVRSSKIRPLSSPDWALLPPAPSDTIVNIDGETANIQNGRVTASVSRRGKLSITNTSTGQVLLEEYVRNRIDVTDPKCSALEIKARDFKPLAGGDYHLTYRLESISREEKIYGMGQYQQPYLDLKGSDVELAHRNSQASVPFALSSLGYGFLWNNPAIGRAVFGRNIMSFEAYSTKVLDFWFTVGDGPREICEAYGRATGCAPTMPEYGLGFWQCKLRYQNAKEILEVARGYHERKLPLDVIVIDFFHWARQGDWCFDPMYWPEEELDAMFKELAELNVKVMVSIWPNVDPESKNYETMLEQGLLIQTQRGSRLAMEFEGHTIHFDATNPEARKFIWEKAKESYYKKGVEIFWLDEAEPEYSNSNSSYDFDHFRYYAGPCLSVGNIYPVDYAKAFYEGMSNEGQKEIVNLIRCAWAGSQRYGALVWSGDIASSWSSFRNQIAAGLAMGISGIPWTTTDIGGFHGGDPNDPQFRELFTRWFQWGAFCPVFRLHGDREPRQPQQGTTGGASCCSGAANEIWSYGEEVESICTDYIRLRETMRPYVRELMEEATAKNTPIMRTLFFEFPADPACWGSVSEQQYMFGHRYLVAPVLCAGQREKEVYLPRGCSWKELNQEGTFTGGRSVRVQCPMDRMPVFERVYSAASNSIVQ